MDSSQYSHGKILCLLLLSSMQMDEVRAGRRAQWEWSLCLARGAGDYRQQNRAN